MIVANASIAAGKKLTVLNERTLGARPPGGDQKRWPASDLVIVHLDIGHFDSGHDDSVRLKWGLKA
jgi:hypothetical protein